MCGTHKVAHVFYSPNGTSAAESLLWRSTCRQEYNFEKK